MIRRAIILCLAVGGGDFNHDSVLAEEPDRADQLAVECRWADGEIKIDGVADEANWQHAERIDRFYLPWLKENARPARTATRARLLWDREFFYFFAEMDDTDLFANIKEHDGRLWENDVFELFFKPADDKPGYYEFQVNPAGAVLDMFIPRRGSGEYARYHNDGPFHVDAKVVLAGTLNRWSDKDTGWKVEGRIPWGDFLRSGGRPKRGEVWNFALCRYDYSVDFEGPELSTSAPLGSKTRPDFHHWEDYAKLRFVGPKPDNATRPHALQRYAGLGAARLTGSPEPLPPYVVERALPQLKLSFPIFAALQPGIRRWIFIDQSRPYANTRICRTGDDPRDDEFEVLLQMNGTAYDIAFHPGFAENGFLFVGWNGADEGQPKQTRITRYTMEQIPPYRLLPDSAKEILAWESDGHNGGAMAFGNDGMLYITSGDGTSDSDTNIKGQGLDHLLAKVLRINVDHPDGDRAYSVPKDNPFVRVEAARPETWAYGLRNPWRITTDRQTGEIWVGNNGQDLWEQVYYLTRGANYGWSVYEGSHPFYPQRKLGPAPVTLPAAEHHHSEARSLTGGVVYRGDALSKLRGMYVYGDYSTGKIWAIRRDGKRFTKPLEVADTALKISYFATDSAGELLIIDHTGPDGGFYRLKPRREPTNTEAFPARLSETGLFQSVARHDVQPALIPYSVNSPLWSDGAHKARYLALPADQPQIKFHPTRSWSFPEATVLVKSFALDMVEGDPQSRRWVETRLLTKQQGEWVGYSYSWNSEQTDAQLVAKTGVDREFEIATPAGVRRQTWHYPSRAECMVCHSRASNFVLGVSTAQLNRNHDYDGVVDNQLRMFESLGVLRLEPKADLAAHFQQLLIGRGLSEDDAAAELELVSATRDQRPTAKSDSLLAKPPAHYDKLANPYDARASLYDRARSYLHVNCASCHRNAGGGNAQIELPYPTKLAEMKAVGVRPLHNTFGLHQAQIIAARTPSRSVLLHRAKLRGTGQMPPLATSLVDQAAIEMLSDWIASLPPPPASEDAK